MVKHCNASQDAQDVWDAKNPSLVLGLNTDRSAAESVFPDGVLCSYLFVALLHSSYSLSYITFILLYNSVSYKENPLS